MAVKTFYASLSQDGNFGAMVDGVAQTSASRTDGWTVAKIASGNSCEFDAGTKQASGSFTSQTTTPKPASFLTGTTANAFKTPAPLTGTFANALWTFNLGIIATTASSQAGRVRLRIFKSANASGASAVELTPGAQVGSTVTVTTASFLFSQVTWSPGTTFTLNNEYLFFVIAWEITTASGSNSGDVVLRTGSSSATNMQTPDFAVSPPITPTANIASTSTVGGAARVARGVVPAQISAVSTTAGVVFKPKPLGPASYPSRILSLGPTGYWRMEETALPFLDSSPSHNDMNSIGGTSPFQVPGLLTSTPSSHGLGFSSTFMERGGALYPLNTFSIEFWVKLNATGVATTILSQYNSGIRVDIAADGTIGLIKSFVGFCASTSILKITDTNTHHVVVTRNGIGGAVVFYLDGVSETPTPTNPSYDFSAPATNGLFIGSEWGNSPLSGTLDEMAIYPTVLPSTAVVNNYQNGSALPSTLVNATSAVSGVLTRVKPGIPVVPASVAATSSVGGSLRVLRKVAPTQISATSTVTGSVRPLRGVRPANIASTSTVSGSIQVVSVIQLGWVPPYSSYGDGGYGQPSYGGMNVFGVTLLSIKALVPAQINATSTVGGRVTVLHVIIPANIAAISSTSGAVRALRKVAGQINATSTVSAVLTKFTGGPKPIVVAPINATSTVGGTLVRPVRPISGAISATSSVSGRVGALRRVVPSQVAATSVVSGALTARRAVIAAAISAISTVSGVLRVLRAIRPTQISAISTVSGAIVRRAAVSGQINAISTASAQVRPLRGILPTQIGATSTVSGQVIALHKIVTAQISSTSTMTGFVAGHPVKFLSGGVVSATSTVSGNVRTLKKVLPTPISATSTVSGSLVRPTRPIVAAQINSTSTTSGRVVKVFFVRPAAISATSTVSGALVRPVRPISGLISSTSSATARVITLRKIVTAAISATSTVSAKVTTRRAVSGQIAAISTVSGLVRRRVSVTGQIQSFSIVTGQVFPLRGVLPAVIYATSTVSAKIILVGTVAYPGTFNRVLSTGETSLPITSTDGPDGSMLSAGTSSPFPATANPRGSMLSANGDVGNLLSTVER